MVRLSVLVLLAFALHADTNAGKPPSTKEDKALRERVAQFYQREVEGRYRDAEEFVAKDSKDYFYASNKPAYLSCALDRIEYQNDAKQAKAWVKCDRNIMVMGFAGQVMKLAVISTWKREKGKWYWYVDPKAAAETPFGSIAPANPGGRQSADSSATPFSMPETPAMALNKVKADKAALSLKPGSTAQLTFSNAAPGVMSVSCATAPEGFSVSPAKAQLQKDGSVTVTVKALEGAAAATLSFEIDPTGEVITIPVKIE